LQQQPNPQSASSKKTNFAYILSLIAGVLVLIRGIFWIVRGELNFLGTLDVSHRIFRGFVDWYIGVFAIIFAIIILIGAVLINMPGKALTGGILVLIFSVLRLVTGGGFLIGFILGFVGGILALMKK
jgi:hypothetical protein